MENTTMPNEAVQNTNVQMTVKKNSKKELIAAIMIVVILIILGIATYVVLNAKTEDTVQDNDNIAQEDTTEEENSIIVEDTEEEPEDCDARYTNNKLPGFSFEYNNCEWTISEDFEAKILDAGQVTLGSILLTNGENKISFTFQPFMTNAPGWICSDETFVEVEGDIARYTITAPNLSLTTYSYVLMENYTDENSEGYEMLSGTSNFDRTKNYCYSNMNAWDQMTTTYLNKDLPYAETDLPDEVLNRAAFADMGITVILKDNNTLSVMESIVKSIEVK